MNIKWTIEANWWSPQAAETSISDSEELTEKYRDELEEHAFERVVEMSQDGFVQGELNHTVHDEDSAGNDVEIGFRGWWCSMERAKTSEEDEELNYGVDLSTI